MGCIYMDLYIHGSEITVSLGKFLCLAQFYSTCPSKFWALSFHVFSNLTELIWLSLAVPKMTGASAFLHFPGKKPQPPKHVTSGMEAVLCQLLGVPAPPSSVRCRRAQPSSAAQELPGLGCAQCCAEPAAASGHPAGGHLWHGQGKHHGKSGSPGRWGMRRSPTAPKESWFPPTALREPIQLSCWPGLAGARCDSAWLLIKGLLSNNPLHISRSCCQEPWTSLGCKTTDKADAEKSSDACIGQSEWEEWLLENVICILALQLEKPDLLVAPTSCSVWVLVCSFAKHFI